MSEREEDRDINTRVENWVQNQSNRYFTPIIINGISEQHSYLLYCTYFRCWGRTVISYSSNLPLRQILIADSYDTKFFISFFFVDEKELRSCVSISSLIW